MSSLLSRGYVSYTDIIRVGLAVTVNYVLCQVVSMNEVVGHNLYVVIYDE